MKLVLRGLQQPQQALREGEQRQHVAKRRDQQQQAGLEIPDQRDHCLAKIVAFSHRRRLRPGGSPALSPEGVRT